MQRFSFAVSLLALAASLSGLLAVTHQHASLTFGTVQGLPDPALDQRPAAIVGVNVALEQYAAPGAALEQLAGIPWLRQTFPWDLIEPRPGSYDWSTWDQIVEAAVSRQHSLIAVLNYAPEWAREPGRPHSAPPASAADFGRFAGDFARRYGERIDVYQIWDEPNLLSGWGHQPPSAAGYAGLLQSAYAAIHAADAAATVLAAALAPTVETGPDNWSDAAYLQQLYDLGAGRYFDAAAGKPYGFYTGPDDRQANPALLNFSRLTLLRAVMVRNGDAHKLLWGGNFGWNRLASPWGQSTPEQQAAYTRAAYQRAAREWPWAGVLALETFQPDAPYDDPRWGFALLDQAGQPTALREALQASQVAPAAAPPGNYDALVPAARYTGNWEFSELGADIPEDYANAAVTFTFEGTDLGLAVRRGDYRGYLYVWVDGRPGNRLPTDARGAYIVLTAPEEGAPRVSTILAASGLAPDEIHTAVITPDRGWDQWALAGFSVGRVQRDWTFEAARLALAIAALLALGGAVRFGRGLPWPAAAGRLQRGWRRLGLTGQLGITAAASALLYITSWLAWGSETASLSRRFGDALPITLTAFTAGLFYYSPSVVLALAALAALLVLFYLRLDLGLAFTLLFVPFYLQYRLLWQRGFSMVEVCIGLTLAAWLGHNARPWLARLAGRGTQPPPGIIWPRPTALDWGVLAYLAVATLSTAAAELKPVAIREYRLVVLEPVLFFVLLRTIALDRRSLWRLADFFVLGAVLVALIGLYQYVTATNLITAEEGIARIRSVYGSPNNLGLYLERALPITVAAVLIGRDGARRWAHALAAAILAVTTLLTYSKGALLLGVPAGLAVVLVSWLGRRGWLVLAGGAAAGVAALPLLARTPRFAGLLDFTGGTTFFRVKLWVSAWRMFRDHPWLGVGPDNFLYQYRGRYILPEAWQEPNLSHPHNLLLDFLSRFGLLGLACGLWLLVGFWQAGLEVSRRLAGPAGPSEGLAQPERRSLLALAVGLMGLVAAMLAHGLVDHGLFLVDLSYAFFLALGGIQHLRSLAVGRQDTARAGLRVLAAPSAD
ncbi:MAG: O-antigen ligase family protein [Anaerolineales bacterium]|nr:O-antigen ligase family protein [Anaerolineales bacterium]